MVVRLAMIALLIGVVLCGIGSVTAAPPTTKPAEPAAPLSVRIGVQEPNVGVAYQKDPVIHIVLTNTSAVPLGILDEWNSFGYFNMTLDYTLADGTHHSMAKKKDMLWDKNYPSATTVQPGECLVRDVHLDPHVWSGLPTDAGRYEATFTATFKQSDQRTAGVWHGTLQSPPVKVEFDMGR